MDRTNSSNITVREGLRELDNWRPALTDEQWKQVHLVVIDEHIEDALLCTLTSSGKFSVSAYMNMFRAPRTKKDWTDLVWNKTTPFRINAFMWKVFWGAVLVDSNIQRRGVLLTSAPSVYVVII